MLVVLAEMWCRCTFLTGVGNFMNTGVLLILLCVFNVYTVSDQKKHSERLGGVWRLAFGLGLIPIVLIWLYRVFILKASRRRTFQPARLPSFTL